MIEPITLIKRSWADGRRVDRSREVLCTVQSIGSQEFYQASATEYHPDAKIILADYLEYDGEQLVRYNGTLFRVIRTYRAGQRLELTVEKAPAEDGAADG